MTRYAGLRPWQWLVIALLMIGGMIGSPGNVYGAVVAFVIFYIGARVLTQALSSKKEGVEQ